MDAFDGQQNAWRADGGGGGDDDVQVLPVMDLRNKIELFGRLDDSVRKVSRPGSGMREQGYREIASILTGASAVPMIKDKFTDALSDYIAKVKDNAKAFVAGYTKFKAECEALIRNNAVAVKPTAADIDTVSGQLSQLRLNIARYPEVEAAWTAYASRQSVGFGIGSVPIARPAEDPTALRTQIVTIITTLRQSSSLLHRILRYAKTAMPSRTSEIQDAIDQLNKANLASLFGSASASVMAMGMNIDMNMLLSNIANLIEDTRVAINEPSTIAASVDAFDAAKSTADDYARYHGNPTGMPATIQATLLDGVVEALEQHVTTPALYVGLGRGLVLSCRAVREDIEAWMKSNPLNAQSQQNAQPQQPQGSASMAHLHSIARSAVEALIGVETKLLMSVNEEKRISELDELARRLLLDPQFARAVSGRKSGKSGGPKASSGSSGDGRLIYASSSSRGRDRGGESAGDAFGGVLSGFLYRRVDPIRVARYLEQAERFRDAVISYKLADHVTMQITRLKAMASDMERQYSAVKSEGNGSPEMVDPSEMALRGMQLAELKVDASKAFANGVRRNVASFVRMHHAFVSQRHGDAIRYMLYWKEVAREGSIDDDDVAKALDDHAELLTEIANQARTRLLDDVRKPVLNAALEVFGSGTSTLRFNESQQATVDARMDALGRWIVEQSERVDDLYLRGTPTLLDSLLDPQILALYVLKALRVAVAWFTLGVASNTFQAMYTMRVHTRDEPPPHPALFVAMLLGADLAVHLLVLVVLLTLMRVFKSIDNDFLVDGTLIRLWLVDYALTTVSVGALALIIGVVIRNKKYFRYKYEGDRGIRAMRDLVFYTYCIMAPVPFFRIIFG